MRPVEMTETVTWEESTGVNNYGDPITKPPVELPVRQIKGILTNQSTEESDKPGFLRVYLCYNPSVKARDLIDGNEVKESRNITDVFGKYVYTKVYVKV